MFYSGDIGIFDEYLIKNFRRSKVTDIKVSRQNIKDGPLADLNDAVMFTNHQKTVTVSRDEKTLGKIALNLSSADSISQGDAMKSNSVPS